MKKAKIAIVGLGHYIYFDQFEGLREELMQKASSLNHILIPNCATLSISAMLTAYTLTLRRSKD